MLSSADLLQWEGNWNLSTCNSLDTFAVGPLDDVDLSVFQQEPLPPFRKAFDEDILTLVEDPKPCDQRPAAFCVTLNFPKATCLRADRYKFDVTLNLEEVPAGPRARKLSWLGVFRTEHDLRAAFFRKDKQDPFLFAGMTIVPHYREGEPATFKPELNLDLAFAVEKPTLSERDKSLCFKLRPGSEARPTHAYTKYDGEHGAYMTMMTYVAYYCPLTQDWVWGTQRAPETLSFCSKNGMRKARGASKRPRPAEADEESTSVLLLLLKKQQQQQPARRGQKRPRAQVEDSSSWADASSEEDSSSWADASSEEDDESSSEDLLPLEGAKRGAARPRRV